MNGEYPYPYEMVDDSQPILPRTDLKLAKFLVRDQSIPDDIKDIFWSVADKEIVLAKLRGREDEANLKNKFAILKNLLIMSIPPQDITLDFIRDIENLGTKWEIKMTRADEGFERQQLNTSIAVQEHRGIQRTERSGLFQRLGAVLFRRREER